MKQKAILIIRGNLIAKHIGGGNLFSIQNNKFLERYFDTEGAITIDGDLRNLYAVYSKSIIFNYLIF